MKNLFLILLISVSSLTTYSAHISGGDSYVEQIGPNQFEITCKFYRDCNGNGTNLSSVNFSIRVFDNVTNAQVLGPIAMTRFNSPNGDTLTFGDECFTAAQIGLCVHVGIFKTTINLPNNPNGYYFTYRTPPNRNGTILNINSGSSNIWYGQIPDPALVGGNSSPRFVNYPPDAYMCVFNPKDIDFSCTDVDGDSLVYSLITPIDNMQPSGSRPFINVAWTAGHNLANILGAGTACTINPQTGIVSTRSGRLGNYVVAVKCEEYRGGVKIGEVYRDLVLASLNCIFNSKPILEDFELSSVFEFEKEKCIDFVAMDPNLQDTFYLEINSNAYQFGATSSLPPANNTGRYDFSWTTTIGGIDTANNLNVRKLTRSEFEGVGRVGARFCWNLDQCEVLSVDSFWVNVVGFSLGCDGSRDTVSKTVSLPIEKPESDYIIPNVFSPDGDGINDEFYLKQDAFDRCYDALNIKIYNRWGQQVFQSDDAKFSWDGNDESGKELAAGTYFVVLQGFYGGKEVTQNYPVTLFR